MKCEWKKVRVGELGQIITGKTPKTSISDNYGGNIPFLTPSDDMITRYVAKTKRTLTDKGLREVKSCILPKNSVCVSCIGSDLGKVVITTEKTISNQQINSIIVDKENFDVSFVYYAMLMLGKKLNYISKTSTAVPIINKTTFSSYSIMCPEIKQQREIASILSSLDDKIELNNKINENLEQQAKSLYTKIFLNNSESEITLATLSDIATITMGQSPNGNSYNEDANGTVFYQGRAEFGFRFPTRRLFTTEPTIVKMEIALSSYTRCLLSDLSLMFLMEKVLFTVLSIVMR